jgi:hypothetical protein
MQAALVVGALDLVRLCPANPPALLHLYQVPLAVLPDGTPSLGSLAFLDPEAAARTQGIMTNVLADCSTPGPVSMPSGEIPPLSDLVIMNPPYARSSGSNQVFGGLPPATQKELAWALNALRRRLGFQWGQAGQAADFLYLATRMLRPGGRIAFVLPRAFLFGSAWEPLRTILVTEPFRLDLVATLYSPTTCAFSEGTSLAECLVIATKTHPGGGTPPPALGLFLRDYPDPGSWDLISPESLRQASGDVETPAQLPGIATSPTFPGHLYLVPQALLAGHPSTWAPFFGFPSRELHETVLALMEGRGLRDSTGRGVPIPVTRLDAIVSLGPDRSGISKATDAKGSGESPEECTLSFHWGRDNTTDTTLVTPAASARVAKPHLHAATLDRWRQQAGHLLLPESLRLTTSAVVALWSPTRVLSNVYWPGRVVAEALPPGVTEAAAAKALALWYNSSVGYLLLHAARSETDGAWVSWKKAALLPSSCLDLRALDRPQLDALAALFDEVANDPRPAPFLYGLASGQHRDLDAALLGIVCPATQESDRLRTLDSLYGTCAGFQPMFDRTAP